MNKRMIVRIVVCVIASLSLTILLAAQEEKPVPEPEATPEITPEAEAEIDYAIIWQSQREDGAFVLGDEDSLLSVVVFSDFLCLDCLEYAPVITQFIRDYVAERLARVEYRLFPVVTEESTRAAQLAECAGEQDAFWAAREWLFAQFAAVEQLEVESDAPILPELDETLFVSEFNLDDEAFTECMEDAEQHITDTLLAIEMSVISVPAVMFRIGDNDPQWVRVSGEVFNDGGLPFELLELAVEAVNR